ncbi:MAG: AAA family ATPase [Planctomyces sp.]|nr:AAA family ATPase [Planctomyces sp.]
MEHIPAALLRWQCDPELFTFHTTADLPEMTTVFGHQRAVDSIRFGIAVRREGYNIFALGPQGTGKQTIVERCLREQALTEPTPPDWCYVNNFDDLRRPIAIQLPSGSGVQFRNDVDELIEDLTNTIPAALESEEHRSRLAELEHADEEQQDAALQALADKAESQQVQMMRTPGGFMLAPAPGGKVLEAADFDKLSREQRKEIEAKIEELQKELQSILEQIPWQQKLLRDKVKVLRQEVLKHAIGNLLTKIKQKYSEVPPVSRYLVSMETDILKRVNEFQQGDGTAAATDDAPSLAMVLSEYGVNLLIDNSGIQGAPIVYEDHPSYHNLIGRVEHETQMGALTTDFSLVKAGALHRANGGYLILDTRQLLQQPFAWEGLKRSLYAHSIRMESLGDMMSLISTISLEPEPIPLNLKVVLLGDRLFYYLLYESDPDFAELFKVCADFDDDLERTAESCNLYAVFLASVVRREKLLPLTRAGVAKVLECSVRMSDDTERLSMHARPLTDLLREADFIAVRRGSPAIDMQDVVAAASQRIYRSDRLRERLHHQIQRGLIRIEVEGSRVGQINGLSVLEFADVRFGQPSRITATVRPGRGDVVNIEREVELSGPGHSKGVMILAAFLGHRFAQENPLSLTASLVFEQSYGLIDGDSASIAETCALLSALSNVPIEQGIAVTGSMDQFGNAQPIGGVNEKIEGFFRVCSNRGLNGKQGVLIPETNRQHLMLHQDVVDAVSEGLFFVATFVSIDDAVERLTGRPSGRLSAVGTYPADSINGEVAMALQRMTELRKAFHLDIDGDRSRKTDKALQQGSDANQ